MAPRQLVIAALAQLHLWNQPPVTVKHLQERCGVSYPTVAAVLKGLADKGWLEDSGERGVRLRHLTLSEWMDLAREHASQRKAYFFTDPTGQSLSDQLVKRLERLKKAGKLPWKAFASAASWGHPGTFLHWTSRHRPGWICP
jgi:DNA-binding MarR family transcriptional regulator